MIQKELAVGILFLFLGTNIIPSTTHDTAEQSPLRTATGNTFYVGGSGPGNYSKIQDGVNNASEGDTIFVYRGTYYENIDIDKIINLVGEDKNITIIDGGGKHDVICIHNDNDGVTLSGFTIQNSGNYSDEYTEDCGVDILSNNNTIQNNVVSYHPHCGIRIGLANSNKLTKNIIKNNPNNGLWVEFSDNNTIIDNIFFNNIFCGIEVDNRKKNIIYPVGPIHTPYIGRVDYDPASYDWPPVADVGVCFCSCYC